MSEYLNNAALTHSGPPPYLTSAPNWTARRSETWAHRSWSGASRHVSRTPAMSWICVKRTGWRRSFSCIE